MCKFAIKPQFFRIEIPKGIWIEMTSESGFVASVVESVD